MAVHHLTLLPDTLAICRLDADAALPAWATAACFSSITRTTEELSIVCGQSVVPDGIRCERDSRLDTGSTVTANSLQATMAVLATSTNKARQLQDGQHAHLRFHVFDILRSCGQDVTPLPLMDRQDLLATALRQLRNEFIEAVPSYAVNKPDIHRHIIDSGGEGTVWKKAASPYEPGRRVNHWIKRKRGMEVEAFVTGFKPGTNGHAGLVGAVEFSVRELDGSTVPIAWVSSLSDSERLALTQTGLGGHISIGPSHLGRRAIISGQELSARARRIRHARLVRWIDTLSP